MDMLKRVRGGAGMDAGGGYALDRVRTLFHLSESREARCRRTRQANGARAIRPRCGATRWKKALLNM